MKFVDFGRSVVAAGVGLDLLSQASVGQGLEVQIR